MTIVTFLGLMIGCIIGNLIFWLIIEPKLPWGR